MRDSAVFPEESDDCAILLDELAIGDGNGIYGFGSVLSVLIKEADIDGVRRHLDVAAANGFAASAGHLCLAARIPRNVCADAGRRRRARDVLLAVASSANERTLGQRVVLTELWSREHDLGGKDPEWRSVRVWGYLSDSAVTVLHQFAWEGDADAVARVLALRQCSASVVNAVCGDYIDCADDEQPLEVSGEATALHYACLAGRPAVVKVLLSDGRADVNARCSLGGSTLSFCGSGIPTFQGRINHSLAECVRALSLDSRLDDESWWYPGIDLEDGNGPPRRHVLNKLARFGGLELTYHALAANKELNVDDAAYGDGHKSVVEMCADSTYADSARARTHHDGLFPTLMFLVDVANAGSFQKWRAERARDMLVLRLLVTKARHKRRRREMTLVDRFFLLRDDAIFLHVLGFCWFLNPRSRVPSVRDHYYSRHLREGITTVERCEEAFEIANEQVEEDPMGLGLYDHAPASMPLRTCLADAASLVRANLSAADRAAFDAMMERADE